MSKNPLNDDPLIPIAPLNAFISEASSSLVEETTNLIVKSIAELEADLENLIYVIKKTSEVDEGDKS